VRFRSDVTVKLVRSLADDEGVVQAARVSYEGENTPSAEAEGLINFLMRNKHGSPFEHNSMTFYIEAPIFVFREFHRHRIGWSYNEESARYKKLEPVFYIPGRERKIVQEGKAGTYTMVSGDEEQWEYVEGLSEWSYKNSYRMYTRLLEEGIAREVARNVLPTGIYSSMYATCNARSLMAFLALRTDDPSAAFPSKPLREIAMVAEQMEDLWTEQMPLTAQAFKNQRRVAP